MCMLPYLMLGELNNRVAYYINRGERGAQLLQPQNFLTSTIEEVSSSGKPLVQQMRKISKTVKSLIDKLPQQEACVFLHSLISHEYINYTKYIYVQFLHCFLSPQRISFHLVFVCCMSSLFTDK